MKRLPKRDAAGAVHASSLIWEDQIQQESMRIIVDPRLTFCHPDL